ncbi:MAG: hypothetical protein ACOY0T_35600 [Myxococcota bacterium]
MSIFDDLTKLNDRDLVVQCLHHNGALQIKSTEVQRRARLECDGFGDLKTHAGLPGQTKAERDAFIADLLWDWSHVRDSSDGALRRAAAVLRAHLGLSEAA